MIELYMNINRILRAIVFRARDGIEAWQYDDGPVSATISIYIERDVRELERIWPEGLDRAPLTDLKEKVKRPDTDNFRAIVSEVIPKIEDVIDGFFSTQPAANVSVGIIDFLHLAIIASSYTQFRNIHFRDAVFNAFLAVFDLIRERTKVDKDGNELIGDVFSLSNPKLVISTLKTESGRNEQKGYLQILQGVYSGIRNPKAHSLSTDLNEMKAAQYLILASLLARRIDEASVVDRRVGQSGNSS